MGTSSPLANTTPFPNHLFDLMSVLTGSEWALLCLVVRQTHGWTTKNGDRKTSDWMTNRMIQIRIGHSSTAVSRAIELLVRKGVLEVRDGRGKVLQSPAERRRSRRLHFSVVAAKKSGGDTRLETKSQVSIKESGYKKVATTKENVDKKDNTDFVDANLLQGLPRINSANIYKLPQQIPPTFHIDTMHAFLIYPQLRKFIIQFQHQQSVLSDPPLPLITKEDIYRLHTLLDSHGFDGLTVLADAYFHSHHHLLRRHNYSLPGFLNSINILLSNMNTASLSSNHKS